MANNDIPRGLVPVGRNGGSYTGQTNLYYGASGYATGIFIGDPVTLTGESNTAVVNDHGIGTLPAVNLTGAGTGLPITAVVVGVIPVTQESTIYREASTERILVCVDDPDVMFEIQADGAVPAASMGLNAVFIAAHAGSTATGKSGYELDSGTATAPGAAIAHQLKIRRAVDRLDNDTTIIHPKILVTINNHTFNSTVIGV
ncbi:hypothetical protein KAR91_20280 [Candidatus Pacearchaeota archaeon]|nr:hypothetical protein [Candidatus Pacearchaeota archaeon]